MYKVSVAILLWKNMKLDDPDADDITVGSAVEY